MKKTATPPVLGADSRIARHAKDRFKAPGLEPSKRIQARDLSGRLARLITERKTQP